MKVFWNLCVSKGNTMEIWCCLVMAMNKDSMMEEKNSMKEAWKPSSDGGEKVCVPIEKHFIEICTH